MNDAMSDDECMALALAHYDEMRIDAAILTGIERANADFIRTIPFADAPNTGYRRVVSAPSFAVHYGYHA